MNASRLLETVRRNGNIVGVWLVAFVFFIIASTSITGFLGASNLRIVLAEVVILAFAAAAETIVIVGGGIDVSVQAVMSGSAVFCAQEADGHNGALLWVIPLIMGLAMVVGLFNGLGIIWLGVSPIMMTIASNVMVTGIVFVEHGVGAPTIAPPGLQKLAHGTLLGLPIALVILVGLAIVMWFLFSATAYGRRLYAIGSSPLVSRLSGVNPGPITVVSYMLSSISAACSGIMILAFIGTATLGIGSTDLFIGIAAVAVGGVSFVGGSGHYIGVVAATIVLTLVTTILTAHSIDVGVQDVVFGLTILICVWLATRREERGEGSRRRGGGGIMKMFMPGGRRDPERETASAADAPA